jgi:hypothetical protein
LDLVALKENLASFWIITDKTLAYNDSAPLFSLVPFSHLHTVHLVFADNRTDRGDWMSITWLESSFKAIVLEQRLILCLTISTVYERWGDWETRLHLTMLENPTVLLIQAHMSQTNSFVGRKVTYGMHSCV